MLLPRETFVRWIKMDRAVQAKVENLVNSRSASLLPLLPKKEGRGEEAVFHPSLQLSPRSFLAGREGKTLSSFVMPNTIAVTPALPLFFADTIVD